MRRKDGESIGLVYTINKSCMRVHHCNTQVLQWWKVLGDAHSQRHKRVVVFGFEEAVVVTDGGREVLVVVDGGGDDGEGRR